MPLAARAKTVRNALTAFAAAGLAAAALTAVVERHDNEVDELLEAVSRDETVILPRGPMPTGWYVALAARVLDAEPSARVVWEDDDFGDADA